jgi:hypothetical protein
MTDMLPTDVFPLVFQVLAAYVVIRIAFSLAIFGVIAIADALFFRARRVRKLAKELDCPVWLAQRLDIYGAPK